MKIDEDKFGGFKYTKYLQLLGKHPTQYDNLLNDFYSVIVDLQKYNNELVDDFNKLTIKDVENVSLNNNYDTFFFTKTSIDICLNIKIPKIDDKNVQYLRKIENQHSQYIIDNQNFIIFEKKDNNIFGYYLKYCTDDALLFVPLYIDLNSNIFIISDSEYLDKKETNNIIPLFLRTLIYTNLSDTEFKFIKPNEKIGSRRKNTAFKNNTKFPFHIVDSVWNNIVIRKEGFKVMGHFRLQPCGVKSMDRKLIWITEHKKDGYIRGLRKRI